MYGFQSSITPLSARPAIRLCGIDHTLNATSSYQLFKREKPAVASRLMKGICKMNNAIDRLTQDNSPVKVALYSRVSSHEQAKKGISLKDQQERLEMLAQMESWQIVGIYSDEGYTGANDNRPELQKMLYDAKAGLFNVVVVTKIDRFFRNTRLILNYIDELEKSGVSFIAHDDNIDTRQPGMSKLLLNMLSTVAEFERERIGERIRDARAHLASKGQWSSGRTPFGYRYDKKKKELIIDPIEAESIRGIFKIYTENEIGIIRTAEKANELELITPRPGRRQHTIWTESTIRHVLTHPSYKGGPNDNWNFKTPEIVKPEIWEAAQRRLKSNRHFRTTDNHSPYQGLLRCGLCGHTIRVGYNHGTKKVYECPGRLKRLHLDGSERCTLPRFEVEAFEKRLNKKIAEILNEPSRLFDYIGETVEDLEKEKAQLERTLKPIQGNINKLQQEMERADAMFTVGRLSTDEYKARIVGAKKRIKELEKQSNEADPLLLQQLTDNEKQLKYWAGFAHLNSFFEKRGKKLRTGPAMDVFSILQGFGTTPDLEITDNPEKWAAQQLRNLGLYVYLYPEKMQIKGTIGQTNISSNCRSTRFP
jgi:site-specific DNA recombinase